MALLSAYFYYVQHSDKSRKLSQTRHLNLVRNISHVKGYTSTIHTDQEMRNLRFCNLHKLQQSSGDDSQKSVFSDGQEDQWHLSH